MDSVGEDGGTIDVCAEIAALPAGGLDTDLMVTLMTSSTEVTGDRIVELHCIGHTWKSFVHA